MKRITIADSLRGFSLLGIFLANLLIFQFSLSGKELHRTFPFKSCKPRNIQPYHHTC